MHIRPMTAADLPMLDRHRVRHSLENGRDGDFIFSPLEEPQPASPPEALKREAEALALPLTAPGWTRVWILTDETEAFGEITLVNKPSLPSLLHRCTLMMGIERSARGQGWGSKLMTEAVRWAKQQPGLDWITLFVFETNPPAKALY